jgi:hypothetical protein
MRLSICNADYPYSVVREPIDFEGKLRDSLFSTFSGGDSGGVTPDPIPNSAVKPSSADGTIRSPYGRVGRCRIYIERPTLILECGPFAF